MKEANGTMSFSALWAKSPCPGTCPLLLTNSWPLSSLVAYAKQHHLMVHFVFTAVCHDHGQRLWLCWAKASQKGSYNMGMWNCPCCRMEEALSHTESMTLGLTQWHWLRFMPSSGVQGCAKWHPVSFGVFFIKTADKPRVVYESHLPKIQQVK